jgi:hypothetical protein
MDSMEKLKTMVEIRAAASEIKEKYHKRQIAEGNQLGLDKPSGKR